MTSKRIFVLNGHPAEMSLSRSMTEAYAAAARDSGHEVRVTRLHDLDFDMDFGLEAFQKDIEWAQHIVLITPMWWGGLPAKLKGLIDRAFLPGWAYDTRSLKFGLIPKPMLTGRTARAIVTSDTPGLLFSLLYRKSMLRQIKGQIFQFVGFKPARITHFAPTSHAKADVVGPWLRKVEALGRQAA